MYVRNRFTIEIYWLTHSVHTSYNLARAAHDAIAMESEVEDSRTSPDVRKTVNCSTKE